MTEPAPIEPQPLPVPPSGREVVLRSGSDSAAVATVVEVGGGLRTYDVAGVPVVDGYPRDVMASAGRGQPLIPWPNRIRGGRYEWDGRTFSAPLNEPAKGNAIHGFTRWHNWTLSQAGEDTASAALRLHPLTGYPFTLDLRTDYALDDGGLTVTTRRATWARRPARTATAPTRSSPSAPTWSTTRCWSCARTAT